MDCDSYHNPVLCCFVSSAWRNAIVAEEKEREKYTCFDCVESRIVRTVHVQGENLTLARLKQIERILTCTYHISLNTALVIDSIDLLS